MPRGVYKRKKTITPPPKGHHFAPKEMPTKKPKHTDEFTQLWNSLNSVLKRLGEVESFTAGSRTRADVFAMAIKDLQQWQRAWSEKTPDIKNLARLYSTVLEKVEKLERDMKFVNTTVLARIDNIEKRTNEHAAKIYKLETDRKVEAHMKTDGYKIKVRDERNSYLLDGDVTGPMRMFCMDDDTWKMIGVNARVALRAAYYKNR